MHGKKVLVTGGFGNLGSWVVKYLASLNIEIFILTRKKVNKFENIKYRVIESDIINLDSLEKSLNFDIDYCVHLASYNEFFKEGYPKKALEINTLGTRNLLEVLSKKSIENFIYFSTFHVYGTNSGVVDENYPLNPKNDYASTHLFAEYYVKQFANTHNLKYTIFRLTNSYGAPTFSDTDKWYLILNDLVKSAYENKKIVIKSNGEIQRDFIHMKDVAKAIASSFNLKDNEIYNLGSGKSYKLIDIAYKIKNIYEKRYNKNIDIEVNKKDKTIYNNLSVDIMKIKKEVDFEVKDMFTEEINKIFDLLESIN